MKSVITLALALCPFYTVAGEDMTSTELEEWFNQDEQVSTEQVNAGELRFLPALPREQVVLQSLNILSIDKDSIENGWVSLGQCYKHLDAVADAEVVYRYTSIRDLKVTSRHNISAARVEGQSVQLTNITRGAELCVEAKVRIFYKNTDGTFSLVNGPFHRKFLDGYYPYHVTLKVYYPSDLLIPSHTEPGEQPGFNVNVSEKRVLIDSYFEGILNTEIVFLKKGQRD